jgi:hypothetical protein
VAVVLVMLVAGVFGTLALTGPASAASPAAAAPPVRWVHLTVTSAPSDRDQVMMGYDPSNGKVVLFGGYDPAIVPLGDTWTFHAGAWTQLTNLTVSPPARWGGGFVYDAHLSGMLLFGGRNLTQFFQDTWLFNATGWHHLTTFSAPSPRSEPAMGYNPATGHVLLFGGGIGNLPAGSASAWTFYADTWSFNGHTWSNISSTVGTGPSARFGGQLGWDATNGYMFFEGGNSLLSNGTQVPQNDSWKFTTAGWTLITATGSLPAVVSANGGMMTWDFKSGSFILYGGEYGSTVTSQTWSYVSGAWTNLTGSLVNAPSPRSSSGFTDDRSDGAVLLFAGTTPPPNYTYRNDAWALV